MRFRVIGLIAATVFAVAAATTSAQTVPAVEVVNFESGSAIQTRVPIFTVRVQPDTAVVPWTPSGGLAVRLDGKLLVDCRSVQALYPAPGPSQERVVGRQIVRYVSTAEEGAVTLFPNQQVSDVPLQADWSGTCGLTPDQFRQSPPPTLGRLAPGRHTVEFLLVRANSGVVAASTMIEFIYAPAPEVIVYENAVHRGEIFGGTASQRGLGPATGGPALEQYTSIPAGNSFTRVGRVSGRNMVPMTARAMAAFLEAAVNRACDLKTMTAEKKPHCMGLAEIAVDEITPDFRDWTSAEVAAKGKRSAGARLSEALGMLAAKQAPWGEPYSEAINLYVSGDVAGGIAGLGTNRYRGMRGALRDAGGVLLEMYRGSPGAGAKSFSASEWQRIPSGLVRLSGRQTNVHFVMTSSSGVPKRARCANPMACQWAWAQSTSTNRAILENRPATYRTGDQALEWLAQYNARFPR